MSRIGVRTISVEYRAECFAEFEQMGESKVRLCIDSGEISNEFRLPCAIEWLRLQAENRALEASAKRDAREESTLSIAKEANRLASEANSLARSSVISVREQARWARWAAIIAATAMIIAAKYEIFKLINWISS
jgi:hypothetical protein